MRVPPPARHLNRSQPRHLMYPNFPSLPLSHVATIAQSLGALFNCFNGLLRQRLRQRPPMSTIWALLCKFAHFHSWRCVDDSSTSPSVYIAFQTLEATNYCGEVGDIIRETTIAFSPNDISTARDYSWDLAAYSDHPPNLSVREPEFAKAPWREQWANTPQFWQIFG